MDGRFYLDLENPLFQYLLIYAFLVLLYLSFAGYISLMTRFFIYKGVGGLIDQRSLKKQQVKKEIGGSLIACTIIAVYFYAAFQFMGHLYPVTIETGLLQIFGFIFVYDFYLYFTHRMLHQTRLSKFHARHHKSVRATPWAVINVHPVEALISYLPYMVFAMLVPVSLTVFLSIYAYLLFGTTVVGHGNYNFFANTNRFTRIQELIFFHQHHHSSASANFGFLYSHWDWLFATKHNYSKNIHGVQQIDL